MKTWIKHGLDSGLELVPITVYFPLFILNLSGRFKNSIFSHMSRLFLKDLMFITWKKVVYGKIVPCLSFFKRKPVSSIPFYKRVYKRENTCPSPGQVLKVNRMNGLPTSITKY